MIKDKHMELAIKEAQIAGEQLEMPVGAIIVSRNGKIVASAGNKSRQLCDPTAHAEINAIRQACELRKNIYLEDCTIYVTLEPCSMCIAAIATARVKKLIFGLSSPKFGFFSKNLIDFSAVKRLYDQTEVYGGFYQNEIAFLMKQFFHDKRIT